VSTILYLVLYLLLRHALGIYAANALALALCTVGNTVAHARFTFGATARTRIRHVITAGLVGFLTGVGCTSLGLGLAQVLGATSPTAEAAAIILGTTVAAIVRFILFQAWMFRTHVRSAAKTGATEITPAAA
jgi:putative flippase GtrA